MRDFDPECVLISQYEILTASENETTVLSEEDVHKFCLMRSLLVLELAIAKKTRDFDRVEELDILYDEVSMLIEQLSDCWPDGVDPLCIDESYLQN